VRGTPFAVCGAGGYFVGTAKVRLGF
jgi:hypothetical protein